jgi:2'-5' RNA ligase
MARLFVAADLPEPMRPALGLLEVPGRRVAVESLHVTLCFLGEIDEAQLSGIGDVVCGLRVEEPVPVSVGELLWLPPHRPRVCAIGVVDLDGTLGALQVSLAATLSAGGWYDPERRTFLAHVTLARLRGERRMPAEVEVGELPAFAIPSVSLYRSWPGPRYEALASVALPLP